MGEDGKNAFGVTVREGMIWTYRVTLRSDGRPNHEWAIRTELGGIHVNAFISRCKGYPDEWLGGIECHTPPGDRKPDHEHCWLLNGPCCHDGSSLQFSEQIAPWLPYPGSENPHAMEATHHEYVTSKMLNRYRIWIEEARP